MRPFTRHPAAVLAALLLALAASACASKKATIGPEPIAPAPVATTTAPAPAGSTQPLAKEGFKEDSIKANDMGTGGVHEIAKDANALTEAEVNAALATIYFAYDSDELGGDAMTTIATNAAWLKDHPQVKIQVEGHCDQRGTVEYNLALGARRARAVRAQLVRLGVPETRVGVMTWGKEHPAAEGDGEAVWSKNRRAEFRMTP